MFDRQGHDALQAQLDAFFAGERLEAPAQARAHLQSCASCRAYFEELARLDEALRPAEQDEAEPNPDDDGFLARWSKAQLEARLDAQEGAGAWARVIELRPWRKPSVLAPLAAAAALGALWVGVPGGPSTEEPSEWESRASGTRGVWQLEAYCAKEGGERLLGPARPGEALRCGMEDEVVFAALNHGEAAQLGWLALVGQTSRGELRWYQPIAPSDPSTGSFAVPPSARLSALGQGLRLAVRHHPGELVEVTGIFSQAPIPKEVLEAWAERGGDLARPEGLSWREADGQAIVLGDGPRGVYAVRRLRLEIEGGP